VNAFDRVVAALGDRVTRQRDGQVQARCPSHDDRDASLSVRAGAVGAVLKCFAGCPNESIVSAIGLTMHDLFDNYQGQYRTPTKTRKGGRGGTTPPATRATAQHAGASPQKQTGSTDIPSRNPTATPATPQHPGCTLAAYAAAKRLPLEQLKAFGLTDITYNPLPRCGWTGGRCPVSPRPDERP
jgi:hypothetical protein